MPTLTLIEDAKLYEPNPGGQQGFMDDYSCRYCALAGGWYAGKTWAGARKLIDLHVFNAFDDDGNPTGVDSCVIAPTYQLAETINIPELRKAMSEAGIRFKFYADKTKYWFELPQLNAPGDTSLIYVRTADSADKITGFTVGAIWGDEVARWKSDELNPLNDPILQAKGRLRGDTARFKQFMMTFTHEGDMTKVYEDFEREPKPSHKLYRAGTFDNPHAKEFGDDLKTQLTPTLANQYLGGLAANFRGGNVYDNFSEEWNVDGSLAFDVMRPVQVAIDFNHNPGSHVEIGQWFPDKQLVTTVFEIYEDKMHARRIVQKLATFFSETLKTLPNRDGLTGWKFPGKMELFGDASGSNGQAATGDSCWQEITSGLTNLGIPFTMNNVPSSNPHVADRVAAVNCAFLNMEGKVRYKVHTRCERLIKDFKTLKWDGNELNKKDQKMSHASDADGYRVYQLCPIRSNVAKNDTGRMILSGNTTRPGGHVQASRGYGPRAR